LAGGLHFFWSHFDFIRSRAGLAIGLMRQITRLIALGAAYGLRFSEAACVFPLRGPFSKCLMSFWRSYVAQHLRLVSYALVSGIGAILFKANYPTRIQTALSYLRSCGWQTLGLFFGGFFCFG